MTKMAEDPSVIGKWELLPYNSEVLAVHAAVLPKDKVLFFAGSGNSTVRFNSPDFGNTSKGIWCSVVWDYKVGAQFFFPNTLHTSNGKVVDFFCGGESFLPDGRLIEAGGTEQYDPFHGRRDTLLFDLKTQQWKATGSMADGRWYPTLITLGNGNILAASGLSATGGGNTTLETYSAKTGKWQTLQGSAPLPLYPHLFLLESGKTFYSGGRMDSGDVQPAVIDITKTPFTMTGVIGLSDSGLRNQSASVLLPPAQDQKVMIIGGGPQDESDATGKVDVINFKDAAPKYHPAASLHFPRQHLNAVLLPNRKIFVTGGSLKKEQGNVATLHSETYDPPTNTWQITASSTVARMYHSIALLLPDGRVVASGGNPNRGTQVGWEPPDPNEELRLEIYSPPYMFHPGRPVIDAAPARCKYGEVIAIKSPQAGNIQSASLIKNSVTTHSFNSSQRLVDLPIQSQKNGVIEAAVAKSSNLAPPGWYMLTVLDKERLPSAARWIQLQ
jgi:hypothetical protein